MPGETNTLVNSDLHKLNANINAFPQAGLARQACSICNYVYLLKGHSYNLSLGFLKL